MEEVATRFAEAHPDIDLLVQESGMSDRQREEFLSAFDADSLQPEPVHSGFRGDGRRLRPRRSI